MVKNVPLEDYLRKQVKEISYMPSKPVYSHSNGNLLSSHLFYVGKALYDHLPLYKKEGFFLGICHDFGKLTRYYQEYILIKIKPDASYSYIAQMKQHSYISTLFLVYLLEKIGTDKEVILSFFMASNHHSPLLNFQQFVRAKILGQQDVLQQQVQDLQNRKEIIEEIYKKQIINHLRKSSIQEKEEIIKIINNIDFDDFLQKNFKTILSDLVSHYRQRKTSKSGVEKLFPPYFCLIIYGILINADRHMADKLPKAYDTFQKSFTREVDLPQNTIYEYVKEVYGNSDELKTILFDKVNEFAESDKCSDRDIYTITAPTGSGKTETAFNLAFKLMKKTEAKRIIYSLPLTNIIDENYGRIYEIMERQVEDFDNSDFRYLLKFHHLANYATSDSEEPLSQTLRNVDDWNSRIIVTTFIQLFYTIISNSPNFLYRLLYLNDSIIIIDEPQVLSADYWFLVRHSLLQLTNNYDCKIILMTATKPLIFESDEYIDLTGHLPLNEMQNERTCLVPRFDINNTDDILNQVLDHLDKNSILIVVNTIANSLEVFNALDNIKESGTGLDEYNLFYLSTNLAPYHRKIIEKIVRSNLKKGKKVILVSTQVVEAGVNLDFEVGFRDIAPLDSLIQTAGRVNRKGKYPLSNVYVCKIKGKSDTILADYIYESEFLNFTEEALQNTIHEKNYLTCIQTYFKKVKNYLEDYEDIHVENNAVFPWSNFNFDTLNKKFRIIEDSFERLPILILNNQMEEKLKEYEQEMIEMYKETDYKQKMLKHRKLAHSRKAFFPFLLNVNRKTFKNLQPYLQENKFVSWAHILDIRENKKIYSKEKGIARESDDYPIIW
ncbi:CRISPR-associated helicase Cas3' [Candidatus Woesearchaeota archaeon]|nr:CRISPR-associated helicase Cas3' [Candidatus Woesearchaeota archaeon]